MIFKVTLKDLKEKKVPASTRNSLRIFEQYEKFEDLKADIVKSIEAENADRTNAALRASTIEKLLEKNVFEVPQSLVETAGLLYDGGYAPPYGHAGYGPKALPISSRA